MDRIFDTIEAVAARFPNSIALVSRAGHVTYEHLIGNIASVAKAMSEAGLGPGRLVVLTGASPDTQLVMALALMRLGCRVGYCPETALYETSGVAIDCAIADKPMPDAAFRVLLPERDWFVDAGRPRPALPAAAGDYSIVFSSSGSTGRPKLIEYGSKAFHRRVLMSLADSDVGETPRLLSTMGPRTAAHLTNFIAFAMRGGVFIGPHGRDPLSILTSVQIYRPTYVVMAPSSIADVLRCLDDNPMAIEKVRWLRASGASCAPELQRRALARLCNEFVTFYGSTETGNIAWGYAADLLGTPGSVGQIASDIEVATFDAAGRRLPFGSEGEIRVKNPEGTVGNYIGSDSGRPDAFTDGWFSTGDIGLVDESRNLIVRGRASNVINVGGSKVSPEVLEEELRTLDAVLDVAVCGADMPDGFEKVCAAIVGDRLLSLEEVNGHLLRRKVRWPVQTVKRVAAIPRTESGKIDRVALKRLFSAP